MTGHPRDWAGTVAATLTKITDGDTIKVSLDDPLDPSAVLWRSVRLARLDADERHEPNGPRATAELRALLGPDGSTVYVKSLRRWSLGRLVAEVWSAEGHNATDRMVAVGAAAYMAGDVYAGEEEA